MGEYWLPDGQLSPWNLKPCTDAMLKLLQWEKQADLPTGLQMPSNALGKRVQKRRRDTMHFEKRGLGPGDSSVSAVCHSVLTPGPGKKSGLVALSGNPLTVEVETGRSLASLASQSILIGKLQG